MAEARNITVCARAIARRLHANNGMRLTSQDHDEIIGEIMSAPGQTPGEVRAGVVSLNNLSALNQELERAGLARTERTLNALQSQIGAELVILKAAAAAAPTPPTPPVPPTPPAPTPDAEPPKGKKN